MKKFIQGVKSVVGKFSLRRSTYKYAACLSVRHQSIVLRSVFKNSKKSTSNPITMKFIVCALVLFAVAASQASLLAHPYAYSHGVWPAASPYWAGAHLAYSAPLAYAAPAPILAHEGSYVAANRGSVHVAPLPGHLHSASSINLAPAPGTL
ncbi:adult cuticle protein 1-like [Phlebotomus argentipes]|uniref:adult cuticle protein 1-like n=1 Tax=Phlebotomus argentipes TaxID=94469 RepID=UPI002892EE6B|nr:adult cuticle protein 1-like [Phlebotomus argentipes]